MKTETTIKQNISNCLRLGQAFFEAKTFHEEDRTAEVLVNEFLCAKKLTEETGAAYPYKPVADLIERLSSFLGEAGYQFQAMQCDLTAKEIKGLIEA